MEKDEPKYRKKYRMWIGTYNNPNHDPAEWLCRWVDSYGATYVNG